MKTEIVFISGKQGSGKSTLTNELVYQYNNKKDWQAFEIKFASAIYKAHDEVLKVMRSFGIQIPNAKDGALLQLLGTEWGRKKFGDDVWVTTAKNEIAKLKHIQYCNLLLVISDGRFRNEFDAFPEALRVRLSAHEEVRKGRAESWRDNTGHPSETDLDEYALEERFDLYLDTVTTRVTGCASLIMAQLDKGSWLEKRENGIG